MLANKCTVRPQIKICVPIDKHVYGPQVGKVSPSIALIQRADVLDFRDTSYLKAFACLKNGLPMKAGPGFTAGDEEKVREVLAEGKEVIYHHGGGIAEDVMRFARGGAEIKDLGMIRFINDGSLDALAAGGITFASVSLCGSSRIAITEISMDWMKGIWRVDISPSSRIDSGSEWIDLFGTRLEAFRRMYKGPLGFENNPWKPNDSEMGLLDYVCRFDFINEVFNTFPGIFLHLDIAHAKLSAWNIYPELRAKNDPVEAAKQYMAELPLEKVKEIHISGTQMRADGMHELHNAPAEEDYELLKWLLPRMPQLEYVESEDYKSSDEALLRGMERLRTIVSGNDHH